MKLQTMITSTVLAAAVLMSGCANKEMVEKKHSGFLKSYEGLEEDKKYEGTLTRIMPGADISKYQNIIVSPIQIMSGLSEQEKTPQQKKLFQDISDYLTQGYKDALSKNTALNVVETEGPGTMKLEAAISAVEVHYDDLSWYQFIPISLAATGVARATFVDGNARILGEARLIDSQTGDILVRTVSLQKGEEVKTDKDHLTFEDVKPGLDAWLKRTNDRISELKKSTNK